MPTFKIIVSDNKTGKSERIELKDERARSLIGKRLGEEIEGEMVGISGKSLKITGGSDTDGFPMRPDIHGGGRKKLLVGKGIGFSPKDHGERRRKTLRGSVITEDIAQINMVTIEGKRKPTEATAPKVAQRARRKKKAETQATKDAKSA